MIIKNGQPNYLIISDHGFCQVREDRAINQRGLFSNSSFEIGDVLVKFSAHKIHPEPNYLTVQLGENIHIELFPDFLQYVNHGCSPNVLFNTSTMDLECVAPIKVGDELRFFYPATEWNMEQPFDCNCGSSECLRRISGAAFLPLAMLQKYKLTEFIKSKIERKI